MAAAIQDAYNIAKIKNKGFETELSYRVKIGAVGLNVGGNYTFARNKVIENGTPESPQNQLGNSLNQTYGLIALGFLIHRTKRTHGLYNMPQFLLPVM